MSKSNVIPIEEQLMISFLKGWPEYFRTNEDDYPAIISIAKRCSQHLKIDIDEPEGFTRCCIAIENIASYSRLNTPWAFENLRYINISFQRLFNSMASYKRLNRKNGK